MNSFVSVIDRIKNLEKWAVDNKDAELAGEITSGV